MSAVPTDVSYQHVNCVLLDNSKLRENISRCHGMYHIRLYERYSSAYDPCTCQYDLLVLRVLYFFRPTPCFTRSSISPLVPALNSLPGARATAIRAQMLRSTVVVLLARIDWNSIGGPEFVPHEMGPSLNEIRLRLRMNAEYSRRQHLDQTTLSFL